jgi:hypothetical protein
MDQSLGNKKGILTLASLSKGSGRQGVAQGLIAIGCFGLAGHDALHKAVGLLAKPILVGHDAQTLAT